MESFVELQKNYLTTDVKFSKPDDKGQCYIISLKVRDVPENYRRFLDMYHSEDFLYNSLKERYEYNDGKGTPCEDYKIRNMFRDECPISTDSKMMDAFILWVKEKHSYNPIKQYLNSLTNKWDGEERLETLLIKYLKAEDNKLNRVMCKNWFIQAVRNIFEPCKHKFVHRLVLVGQSDGGKSRFFELLFTIDNRQYFTSDIDVEQDDKAIAPKLNATWLVMFGEGKGIAKKDNAARKQFMDRLTNIMEYQKKFENIVSEYYPHNIICETSNEDKLLNDYTVEYDKRAWLVKINSDTTYFRSVHDEIKEIKDQIWAEAMYYYMQDPNIYLELPDDCINMLKDSQEEYKTIKYNDIKNELDEILNRTYYVEQQNTKRGNNYYYFKSKEDFLAQLKDNGKWYNKSNTSVEHTVNCIQANYLQAILNYKGWDSRHKSFFNKAFTELGWINKNLKLRGIQYNTWYKNEDIIDIKSSNSNILKFDNIDNFDPVSIMKSHYNIK